MADVDVDTLLEAPVTQSNGSGNTENKDPAQEDKDAKSSSKTDKEKEEKKDRDRERGSRRRSRTRSRDRKRSRRSSRSGSRDRRRRSRSRDRSRRRSRRSRSRERRRSRSRSRDRRRRSRSGSRGRSSRRTRKRSRSASRSKSKSRSSSPIKREPSTSAERALRAKEKELAELTRDHRTVFVSQLQVKVKERDIRKFFEQIGPVVKVTLIKDKYTNKSKGFAYVEMANLEDIPKCLVVNGLVPDFQVFPLAVKASEAEKNYAAKLENSATTHASQSGGGASKKGTETNAASRLYVGNLHVNVTEDVLKEVFSAFGEVVSVNVNKDETGRSRGFAFVQYASVDDAKSAMTKAQGLELFGNHIRIGPVNEASAGGGGGTTSGAAGTGTWKLDDDEGTGLQMNAMSRTALMVKLAGGAGKELAQSAPGGVVPGLMPSNNAPAPTQAAPTAGGPPPVQGMPSRCFVVMNMFDPATETEPDWDIEIKEDTIEECSKYGKITHCYVEKNLPGGLVFLQFEMQSAAEACANALNGRWFAGRMITIRYMTLGEYSAKFPNIIPRG